MSLNFSSVGQNAQKIASGYTPQQKDAIIKKSIARGKAETHVAKLSKAQIAYNKLHPVSAPAPPPPSPQQVQVNNFLQANKIPTNANVIGQINELVYDIRTKDYSPPVNSSNIACPTANHSTQCHNSCHEMRHWSNVAGDRFSQGKNNAIEDCVSQCNSYQKGCRMVVGGKDNIGYTFVTPTTPLGGSFTPQ